MSCRGLPGVVSIADHAYILVAVLFNLNPMPDELFGTLLQCLVVMELDTRLGVAS